MFHFILENIYILCIFGYYPKVFWLNLNYFKSKILIKNGTKKGYLEAHQGDGIDLINPTCNNRRERVQKDCSQTLTCNNGRGVVTDDFRIRKLTPKEGWTLMGFDNTDFEKAKATGNSNSQLYKQAGNSIVVDVLEKIFLNLLEE